MYYGKIKPYDIADGEGVRVSLFVSGCRNRCKGCFNPETWSFTYGEPFSDATISKITELVNRPFIQGLTILGGDPFEPENIGSVRALLIMVKDACPNKDVWVYTGYRYEDFLNKDILHLIDVLVDGKFVEARKDISLRFRGSSNQRIIDVPASLSSGHVILSKFM